MIKNFRKHLACADIKCLIRTLLFNVKLYTHFYLTHKNISIQTLVKIDEEQMEELSFRVLI